MSASKLNNLVIGSARNSLLIPFHFGPFYLTARIMASVRHMVKGSLFPDTTAWCYTVSHSHILGLINRAKVLHPTQHKIGHFGDALPGSQSLGQ